MNHRLDVAYRHCKTTGNPLFVSNDVIQRLALEARRQIGRGEALSTAADDLLAITDIQANGIRYEVSWCVDAPVSNEEGVPVLGLCEYDPEGLPNTALIFANPEAIEQNDTLLVSTLAHEFGHGIFEAPGWIVASQTDALPGLLEPTDRRMFRTVTPDEEHLASKEKGPKGKPNFVEWRANEFMGSFLVPREMLTGALRDCAETMKIPLENGSPASCLVPAADQGGDRGVCRRVPGVAAATIPERRNSVLVVPNGLDPNLMTPAERLREVGEILALGLLRLREKQRKTGNRRDNSLDFTANQSSHGRIKKRSEKP